MMQLSRRWNYILFSGRILLFSVFISGSAWFIFSVLFPPQDFFFNFRNSQAQNNTLKDPRSPSGESMASGRIPEKGTVLGNSSAFGEYSNVLVRITGEDGEAPPGGVVSIRRSQQAFFYPDGPPAPFPKGSLLQSQGTFYQVAPNGTLKRFPSESSVRDIGYDPHSFLPVSQADTLFNRDGGFIPVPDLGDNPPDGSFIKSDGTYYEWRNGKLIPFVSSGAFLFRFPDSWAIPKDSAFVSDRTVSDEWRGFPSGAILAWGDGAYIMDGSTPRAVLGVDIFLSLGYSWDDIIPASDEEISLEQKGKPVTFATPHPDGTIFHDTKTGQYFLVDGKMKHEIRSDVLLKLLIGNRHPIQVSSDSLTQSASCLLTEKSSLLSSYVLACSLPIGQLQDLPGDTYEIAMSFPTATHLWRTDISFETALTHDTLISRLVQLKNRVLSRYIKSQ